MQKGILALLMRKWRMTYVTGMHFEQFLEKNLRCMHFCALIIPSTKPQKR